MYNDIDVDSDLISILHLSLSTSDARYQLTTRPIRISSISTASSHQSPYSIHISQL